MSQKVCKYISLGLHCSVPKGIQDAKKREYSYPFDWLWSPSKTNYTILKILLEEGIDAAIHYMTTGYTYFKYLNNEHYESVDYKTESQMNKVTGLGITHFVIDDEFKKKLKRRFERLLVDIKTDVTFIYADAVNPYLNYHLDEIAYGLDATDDLLKIHELIYPFNKNIKIIYFCWKGREKENVIEYVSYDFKNHWVEVSDIIKNYIGKE